MHIDLSDAAIFSHSQQKFAKLETKGQNRKQN